MNAIWLLIGVLVGGGLVLALVRGRLRALSAESARAADLERRLLKAESQLEHERTLAQERLATLQDAQERLSTSFKALSAEALQASMQQLSELARTQLQATQAEAKGDLE